MYLTDKQKRMLEGEYGYGQQKGMQINVAVGEAMGAERMVDIHSCHLGGYSLRSSHEGGYQFMVDLYNKGAKFQVYTTTNITSGDLDQWEAIGLGAEAKEKQLKLFKAFHGMGAMHTATCTPYLLGHVPRFGQQVCWTESSAITFANSVLGARVNREGGPTVIAAALTGCAPLYGLRETHNRYANILVHNKIKKLDSIFEAGNLGYFFGMYSQKGIVAVDGIDDYLSNNYLVEMCAAAATSGPCGLFHIIGVTPEAQTRKQAFGENEPVLEVEYGESERQRVIDYLNTTDSDDVDWVYMGCPLLQFDDIREVAEAIRGNKVHPNVTFWLTTSMPIKALAERAGYLDILREAGVMVVSDTCLINLPETYLEKQRKQGIRTVVTNSTKQSGLIPGQCGMRVRYGDMEKCIEAAVTGKWR